MPVLELAFGTIGEANVFFENRLHSQGWTTGTDDQRQQALNEGAEIINSLNFLGWPTVSTQLLAFPRQGIKDLDSTIVPDAIKYANFLIALELKKGADPEREARSARVVSRGFSSVRTTYDPNTVPEYLQAGVPSAVAWAYLKPFLADARRLNIHRVS